MGDYFTQILTAAVAGALAELIPPDDAGTAKPLRLIASLLLLCTIALPLLDLLAPDNPALRDSLDRIITAADSLPTMADSYAARTMASIADAGESAAETELVALLCERFGLSPAHIRAEVSLTAEADGTIRLAAVAVYLRGPAILADAASIEAYLHALFAAEATVIVEFTAKGDAA